MKRRDRTKLYVIEIRWSDEDNGYIATVPALPGCNAWGSSRKDAADEIEDAMLAWIDAAEDAGHRVPQPT